MPIYRITAPNGKTYRIEGPPGASDADVARAVIAQYPEAAQSPQPKAPVETTTLGQVKEFGKGLVPGAVGLVESAAIGASALLPEDMEKSARETIKSVATSAKSPFAASAGYEDSVGRKLGEAVGSTVPFLAAGPLGLAGRIGAAGVGVGAGAGEARTRAEEGGATADQRGTATALGIIPGAFEVFAPFRILGRLPDAAKAEGVALARRALQAGGEEAAQEALSGFAQNLIARGVYKPEQELIEGLGEQAAYGGATGAIVQGLLDLAIGRRARGSAQEEEERATVEARFEASQKAKADAAAARELKGEAPTEPETDLFGEPVVRGAAPAPQLGDLYADRAELEQAIATAREEDIAPLQEQMAQLDARIREIGTQPSDDQRGLGLDTARAYEDVVLERARLEQGPQTKEVKARLAELKAQSLRMAEEDIIQRRMAATSAFAQEDQQPGMRDLLGDVPAEPRLAKTKAKKAPEPKDMTLKQAIKARVPTMQMPLMFDQEAGAAQEETVPGAITLEELQGIGKPMRTSKNWFEQNVVGKTPEQVQAMVDADPKLLEGKGDRAKVLREILAPKPPEFVEAPNAQPTDIRPKRTRKRASAEPSVGAPVGQPVESDTAGTEALDGAGVVPTGRDAGPQPEAPRAAPPTVTQQEAAFDELVRAMQDVKAPGYDEANQILEANRNNPAFLREYDRAVRRAQGLPQVEEAQQAPTPLPETPKGMPSRSADARPTTAAQPVDRTQLEPIGTLPGGGTARGAQQMIEPMSDAEARKLVVARQAQALKESRAQKQEAPTPPVDTLTMDLFAEGSPAASETRERPDVAAQRATLERLLPTEAGKWKLEKITAYAGNWRVSYISADGRSGNSMPIDAEDFVGKTDSEIKAMLADRARKNGLSGVAEAIQKPEATEGAPDTPAAPAVEPKAKQVDSSWAEGLAKDVGGTVIPVTDDLALIRGFSALNGQSVYSAAKRGVGRTRVDVDNYSGKDITPAELATLVEAKAKEVAKDRKAFAKNPDGPFKGAKTNVVKSDTVDQRYADYLQSLMATLGMGDVRLFLVHPEDMSGAQAKYGLYGDYYSAMSAGLDANEQGSARLYGPSRKDFYISVKSGMSPAKTVEVLAHELGHVIEKVAFKNAPKETQAAIKAEFNKWLEANKGKTAREWIDALRNRETAESTDVPSDMDAAKLSSYWRSFDEWFADNVSRWATTAKKPVGVVEKFFADLAKQFRALVSAVSGKSFAPNKEVSKFLDAMGPSSAAAWMSADTPTGNTPQAFKASYSFDKIVDSSELMKDEPGMFKQAGKQLADAFSTAEGVTFGDRFRTLTADAGASVETKLNLLFDGAVRTAKGVLNPMGLYRQAQDTSKLLLTWFEEGSLVKNLITGTYETIAKEGVPSMKEVLTDVQTWAKSKGIPLDKGMAQFSKMLEARRLDALRKARDAGLGDFSINPLSLADKTLTADEQIDLALAEYDANPELAAIKDKMDKIRFELIDQMVAVGRLTPEEGTAWKETTDYVPFDRIEDFSTKFRSSKRTGGGIAQLGKLPELVTTEAREVGDVLNNFTKTAGWMLNQVVKQDATLTTLRMLEDIGYAKLLKQHEVKATPSEKMVQTYIKGEPAFFSLPSRWDVLAFKDMAQPKGFFVDLFSGASDLLRKTITSMPPFAVRQVINDIQRAFATSGVQNPYAIILPSLRNFVTISAYEVMGKRHPSVQQFGKLGITGDYDFNTRNPMDSIMYDLGFKARGPLKGLLHRLDGITRASDLAVRKAIYEQTLKESQDTLLAQTRAREFINFRRRGAGAAMPALTATIPFFNAYIQGMDVLYRAATGKGASASVGKAQARRLFASKVATMAAFSAIYAIMMSGDDEYEEADLRTRNNNWLLPGGFKLPVPEELAAIYKVPVEMALEYFRRNGTPEDMEAAEASITAMKYAFEQYLGRTVPIPAAVKPVLEAITNHSFFTGEQLEGTFQRELVSSQRVRSNTSELAKAIANFTSSTFGEGATISPIKIDNFLQGYFGSVSGMLTMATDQMINPDRIDRPLNKYWMLSNFMYDPVGTRRVNEFYDMREKTVPKLNTMRELAKYDPDRAEEYMKVHEQDLILAQSINAALAELSDTRGYKNFLNSKASAASMSMEERKTQLENVRRIEVELVGWLREARASIRNQ